MHDLIEPEPTSGCYLWAGAVIRAGYGKLGRRGRTLSAHRYFWEEENGPIPNGLHVLHKCDVRNCVNPDHMFLGTHGDNMRDMFAKGRWCRR